MISPLFLILLLAASATQQIDFKENPGKNLTEGLATCDTQKLEAFYTFLQVNDIQDFDYAKNAERFFKCGAAATKLWIKKGDGKNPVDIDKNVKENKINFFYQAFQEGNKEVVEELLMNSNHNTIQKILESEETDFRTHPFTKLSCPVELYELFVKYGAQIKGTMILDKDGIKNDAHKIRKLIELGTDINEIDHRLFGNTPLMYLFFYRRLVNKEILLTLLEYNPDTSIKNHKGDTVFDIAAQRVKEECAETPYTSLNRCQNLKDALAHLKNHIEKQSKA